MPPCGYRPPAVESIRWFLVDNLDYFVELYTGRAFLIDEALEAESNEIAKIRGGDRGGVWSRIVVEINAEFYRQLKSRRPSSWLEVRQVGEAVISAMVQDLSSLYQPLEA